MPVRCSPENHHRIIESAVLTAIAVSTARQRHTAQPARNKRTNTTTTSPVIEIPTNTTTPSPLFGDSVRPAISIASCSAIPIASATPIASYSAIPIARRSRSPLIQRFRSLGDFDRLSDFDRFVLLHAKLQHVWSLQPFWVNAEDEPIFPNVGD